MEIDLNWTLLVAGILAAVLAFGKGGTIMDAIKAFFAALTGGSKQAPAVPLPVAGNVASLPSVEDRVQAANLLVSFFESQQCKEGAKAMATVVDHLLDDMKPHEK